MSAGTLSKRIVLVHSDDREGYPTSGSPTDFTIYLGLLHKVRRIALISADVPNTFYNVSRDNNSLTIKEFTNAADPNPARTTTITIPPGQYEAPDFLSTLEAALNSSGSPLTYSLALDDRTSKVTLTASASYIQVDTTHTTMYQLGFIRAQTPQRSQTAQAVIDVRGVSTVYVHIRGGINALSVHGGDGRVSTVIGRIQIKEPFGSTVFYKLKSELEYFTVPPMDIDRLSIQLTDREGRVLDNNGTVIDLNLIVEHEAS
jgi:hypothetical protein